MGVFRHLPLTLPAIRSPSAFRAPPWATAGVPAPIWLAILHISNPSANLWFNPNAFCCSGTISVRQFRHRNYVRTQFAGGEPCLMKKFYFRRSRYLQFRWEAFNAFNHVNLLDQGNLNTTIGQGTTGQIFSRRTRPGDADCAQASLLKRFPGLSVQPLTSPAITGEDHSNRNHPGPDSHQSPARHSRIAGRAYRFPLPNDKDTHRRRDRWPWGSFLHPHLEW